MSYIIHYRLSGGAHGEPAAAPAATSAAPAAASSRQWQHRRRSAAQGSDVTPTLEAPVVTPESVLPAPEEELRMARGGGACGKPAEEERGPAADSDGCSLLTTVPRHPNFRSPSLAVSLTCAHKDP